jgi:peptidylprolyl isomerase
MRSLLLVTSAALLVGAAPPKSPQTPNDIVAAAPAASWKAIPADDLLVIDLKNSGRVVVQLAPAFAPVHAANIRAFARSDWWEGASIYRVQDDYVAQWGLNETDKKPPAGVVKLPPAEYWRPLKGLSPRPLGSPDAYAPAAGFAAGWPVAYNPKAGWATLPHCYGYVGVARDLAPDTGNGSELYAIVGHAPRQLDRNIAVVGRVIDGIERLSSLPRGPAPMGFLADKTQYTPIASMKMASDLPAADRPAYEYMDTASPAFGSYLRLRANRSDQFYRTPAGGVDLCNAPVPVRKKA